MIEFSLSIELGTPDQESVRVDRPLIARSLMAVAAAIQAADKPREGTIHDEAGLEVGEWKIALLGFERRWKFSDLPVGT
jgi:hypothetical protein